MKEGMLWYFSEPGNDLSESIGKAVDFFRNKYGHRPLACYVHSATLSSEFLYDESIKVIPDDKVIKNHLFLEFPEK